jgi:hypothetical protein
MSVTVRTPLAIDEIRTMPDPVARAREAVEFIGYAEARARQGRAVRDDAIRDCRAAGMTIPGIAEQTGVNVATVKAVLR